MGKFFITGRSGENSDLVPVYPGASTVRGFFSSTDIGNLVLASSNNALQAVGTTADVVIALGTVAAVPTATTPGSTTPFWIRPILRGVEYEADYSTTYSATHPVNDDLGKYVGFGATTTVAGAILSVAGMGNVAGTTSGRFFKITGYSTERRTIKGIFNSSHVGD